ncbi:MAG: hypothetical protein K8T89_18610 [Planctomycetes bacterium]|nr:hypothetical protein [Planctomycetota bacterium]
MRYGFLFAIVVSLMSTGASSATVNEKIRKDIKPLAEKIQKIVKEEGQTSIAVDQFAGAGVDAMNFGPGIEQLLQQELEVTQKGIVDPKALLRLSGKYSFKKPDNGLSFFELTLNIEKNNGEKVGELSQKFNQEKLKIVDSDVLAVMTARTTPLPPRETREQLNERIKKSIDEPKIEQPANTRIKTSKESPFELELLTTLLESAPKDAAGWENIAPIPIGKGANGAEANIQRNDVYAVRVFNNTPHDAAVTLTIDGLDVFTFSEVRTPEGRPKYSTFIVPPKSSFIITGWFKTNSKADSFLITEYGKGAISTQPSVGRGKVGVLTVTFALAWSGQNIPEDEKGARTGGNETGFGPPVKVDLPETKRTIGVVRDVISVRYTR